jgi:hypothetical protein
MFKVRFDAPDRGTFPEVHRRATLGACQQLDMLAALSLHAPRGSLREWFGDGAHGDPVLVDNLRRMREVINDPGRTVTFVDARTYDLRVTYDRHNVYAEPRLDDPTNPAGLKAASLSELKGFQARGETLPSQSATPIKRGTTFGEPRPAPGPTTGDGFGYAFPEDSRGDGGPTRAHTGSGMRIYLGKEYFDSKNFFQNSPFGMDMAQTIYHELTHKVLGTNDHWYGAARCRREAKAQPLKARRNADSFAYMVTGLGGYVW